MKICVQCGNSYEGKGIGADRCSRSCHTKWLNAQRDRSGYQYSRQIEGLENHHKNCKQCGKTIAYKDRYKDFCDSSCAASWSNSNIPRLKRGPDPQPFKHCVQCYNWFRAGKKRYMKLCEDCRSSKHKEPKDIKKSSYRNACSFSGKLNKKDHPSLFNSDIIREFGWYSPANKGNNLVGVSWDHLFPVWKGYQMNVPSEIMSHPANAELVPHAENQRRYASKEIRLTLDQLMERIEVWDKQKELADIS